MICVRNDDVSSASVAPDLFFFDESIIFIDIYFGRGLKYLPSLNIILTMKTFFQFFYLLFTLNLSFGQSPTDLVHTFFKGMANADTLALSGIAVKGASLCTSASGRQGFPSIDCTDYSSFVKSLSGYKAGELDEQIRGVKEEVRDAAATVSMEYDFFFRGQFSHCGVNVFHFLKDKSGWKITSIDDTRRKFDCQGEMKARAGLFLDSWHKAAASADSTTYFDALADDAIFIGTDSSEVWNKAQFLAFSAPYFQKGKAWNFTKISRNLHFDGERQMIWFDEMLDTWMGPCRGSGWIAIENQELKIKQYVLSVTVPNDKIEGVLQAIGANRKNRG